MEFKEIQQIYYTLQEERNAMGKGHGLQKEEVQVKENTVTDQKNDNNMGLKSTRSDQQPPLLAMSYTEGHFSILEDQAILAANWEVYSSS